MKSTEKTTRPAQNSSIKKTSIIENKVRNSGSKSREKSLGSVNPTYILKPKNSRNANQNNGIGARMNTQLGASNQ